MTRRGILVAALLTMLVFLAGPSRGESETASYRVGYVGSLSSFAGEYGTAVLEGVRLAIEELHQRGINVTLSVEDDASSTKNAVSSYVKLKTVDKVQGVIAGTWWANAFVKKAEQDGVPLLSCETLYNDDAVLGKTYFIMNGDLRTWVRVLEPVVASRGWKRGTIIRFVSGFGATLAREMQAMFSVPGREFVGPIEYADINMADAAEIALQLKRLKPDVVYVDAQPSSFANLLRKLDDAKLNSIAIMTNTVASEVQRQGLYDLNAFREVYYTKRATFDSAFVEKFRKRYGKEPRLNADLGYYSLHLLIRSLAAADPVATLKAGLEVEGKRFTFDERNVYSGIPQEVFCSCWQFNASYQHSTK